MSKTALITGASSGLGTEFAYLHAANGNHLVLVARSKDKLLELKKDIESIYNIGVIVITKDLSKIDAAKEVYEEIRQMDVEVHYLINNAGFGDFGEFVSMDIQRQSEMVRLNVLTLMELTHLFLPGFLSNRFGKVLNVASTAAFQPGPTMAVYFATKAFVLSFSQALSVELAGTGITITTLCPGATATGFMSTASLNKSRLFASGVADPKSVAELGFKAMMKGKSLVIHGNINKLLVFFTRFVPRCLTAVITKNILKEK